MDPIRVSFTVIFETEYNTVTNAKIAFLSVTLATQATDHIRLITVQVERELWHTLCVSITLT